MKTIGFATSSQYSQLTTDEQLVIPELAKLGVHVVPFVWDQKDLSQKGFDARPRHLENIDWNSTP